MSCNKSYGTKESFKRLRISVNGINKKGKIPDKI